MSVKERILTVRLLEKIAKQPEYADELGIAVVCDPPRPADRTE